MKDEIFVVEVKVAKRLYRRNIDEDAEIDPALIDKDLAQQPSRFAWWATMHHHAVCRLHRLKAQKGRLETKLTRLENDLSLRIRRQAAQQDPPVKLTEKALENEVQASKEYREREEEIDALEDQILEAQEQAGILSVGRETMQQKSQLVISLSAWLRSNIEGDLGRSVEKIMERQRERAGRGGRQ